MKNLLQLLIFIIVFGANGVSNATPVSVIDFDGTAGALLEIEPGGILFTSQEPKMTVVMNGTVKIENYLFSSEFQLYFEEKNGNSVLKTESLLIRKADGGVFDFKALDISAFGGLPYEVNFLGLDLGLNIKAQEKFFLSGEDFNTLTPVDFIGLGGLYISKTSPFGGMFKVDNLQITPVPVLPSAAFLLIGLASLFTFRRKNKIKK